jgi:galactitol-specific phosphotransferase system IIB component
LVLLQTEKANGCLGTEMIKRTSSKDKHYIKNVDIILSNEETEVVTVPQPDTFSKIKDVSQSSNVAATEIITALQLSHTNMDGAPNNIQAADIITEKLKLSNLYNNIVPSDVGVTEIMTEELQLSQANLHIWPAGNKDKSEIAGDHDYEYSQDIGERKLV